jgi:hypothetical protein
MPDGNENRQADNWEPLFAIADAVGGEWPEAIRKIAIEACGSKEDDSHNIRLLADIQNILHDGWNTCHITSAGLVSALIALPDRGWDECNRGRPLTQNGLARKLKPFGIRPKTIRVGSETPKVYEVSDFDDTFARYLHPLFQTETTETSNDINESDENPTETFHPDVSVAQTELANDINDVSIVSDENPLYRETYEDAREERGPPENPCAASPRNAPMECEEINIPDAEEPKAASPPGDDDRKPWVWEDI